jgi:hypothetical protein
VAMNTVGDSAGVLIPSGLARVAACGGRRGRHDGDNRHRSGSCTAKGKHPPGTHAICATDGATRPQVPGSPRGGPDRDPVRFTNHGLLLRRGQQLRCLAAHGNTILGRFDRTRLSGNDALNGNPVDGSSIGVAHKGVEGSSTADAHKGNRVDGSSIAAALKGDRVDGSFIAAALNASDVQAKHCLANHQTYATHQ